MTILPTNAEKTTSYPTNRRSTGYLARFTKAVFESDAVARFGDKPILLALYVASCEDRLFYERPPGLWRSQVMAAVNCNSSSWIIKIRQAAIDAGLLKYIPGSRTVQPLYWTLTPSWLVLPTGSLSEHQEGRQVQSVNAKPNVSHSTSSASERETERETERLQTHTHTLKTKRAQVFDPLSLDLPENLKTERFQQSWNDWIKHRMEIRKPLKETQTRKMLEDFSSWGADRSVRAIDHTIKKGWQGIREPDSTENQSAPIDAEPPHIREKRLLEERRAKQRQEAGAVA